LSEENIDSSSDTKLAEIELPDLLRWSTEKLYNYKENISNYDLETLGNAINSARLALFRVTDQINKYERLEKLAKVEYDRSMRREYLSSMEKTDSLRRARASLACESLENEFIKNEQMKIELLRLSNSLRLELQTLQSIGNNIRQQMKME
jgi:hypothetical protein